MNRRSILIVLGALVVVAVMLAAWFWLFSKGSSLTDGIFGRAGDKAATTTAQKSGGTNISTTIDVPKGGTNTGAGGTNIPLGGTGVTGGTQGGVGGADGVGGVLDPGGVGPVQGVGVFGDGSGTVTPAQGVPQIPGVEWLGGTNTGGSSGAAITTFVPSTINQLNDGTVGGQVTLIGTGEQAPSQDPQYGALFAAAGIGTALCTAGLLGGAAAGQIFTGATAVVAVQTNSIADNSKSGDEIFDRFLSCIARSIGRAIVDQITASVVNWINGGFKGSPSFVQNYQQFFANVADQAAGEYIKGSSLSFLCSPFQLQIRIAIAQSYARRNAAPSCSLSQVVGNVQNFMKGNFSAGGWPGLISFTSMPTNNPFGAYAYAQIGLAGAQSRALQNANRNITNGGFIGYVQTYGCTAGTGTNNQFINTSQFLSPTQAAGNLCPANCKCKTVTPGSIIESNLIGTQNSTLNQLNLAKSFDEIISALITQLMTRTLQQGLSNLSGTAGYQSNFLTPEQQQAQNAGNETLAQLQGMVALAQKYGQTEQGMVADLQSSQTQLVALLNCWESAGKSANASTTIAAITALEVQVAVHNNNIIRANQAIAALQQLQTETLGVTSVTDLLRVRQNIDAALASGVLITQEDVTEAQQDRTTLQSNLSALNQQTQTELAACRAGGGGTGPDTGGGAQWRVTPTSGRAPLTVTFSNWATGGPIPADFFPKIDFGDGSAPVNAAKCHDPSDYCASPGVNTHTYPQAGIYNVRLFRNSTILATSTVTVTP